MSHSSSSLNSAVSDTVRRPPQTLVPNRQTGRAAVWLAGLLGGALGCAATTMLLIATGIVPSAMIVNGSVPGTGTGASTGAGADTIASDGNGADAALDPVASTVTADTEQGESSQGHADLLQTLQEAAAERSQLAATLVSLAREVEELGDVVSAMQVTDGGSGAASGAEATQTDALVSAGGGELTGESGSARRRQRGDSVLEGLVAAGIDPAVASDLQQRNDAWQLARLELVDQASREGWDDSAQLEQRLGELDEERPDLRTELGDAAWDRYLYESGEANRVAIGSVIPGSAAAAAGLAEGDLVLGYAGQSQFSMSDLQAATRAGSRGEPVVLDVERDGQTISLEVPRGPLGVTLSPLRREP